MINYGFYIEVDINGKQRPFMAVGPIGSTQHLGNLALGLTHSRAVKKVLEGIEEVRCGKKEVHHFAGDDWCIVSFRKTHCLISNGMDSFEPFEMDSDVILKFIQDWFKFLKAWENGEIPGLIYKGHQSS